MGGFDDARGFMDAERAVRTLWDAERSVRTTRI